MARDNDYFIRLTLAVYKVTGLFPEKEPLKYQIRELANKILSELVCAQNTRLKENSAISLIEKIKTLLKVAQFQNWVKEQNILIIAKEYEKILEDLLKLENLKAEENGKDLPKPEKKEKNTLIARRESKIPPALRIPPEKRQEKIMNMLHYKKRINLSELKKIFGLVSARTLRRDMEALVKAGIIDRKREGQKDVSYWILEQKPTNRSEFIESGHNSDKIE